MALQPSAATTPRPRFTTLSGCATGSVLVAHHTTTPRIPSISLHILYCAMSSPLRHGPLVAAASHCLHSNPCQNRPTCIIVADIWPAFCLRQSDITTCDIIHEKESSVEPHFSQTPCSQFSWPILFECFALTVDLYTPIIMTSYRQRRRLDCSLLAVFIVVKT